MKTNDVFFCDTNFVGRQMENVRDLVKALDAGMSIANSDGYGYCTYGEKEVEDEDGNTEFIEYEKPKSDLFNEMKTDIEDGYKVYAGFFLNFCVCEVIPHRATTLQSQFYVGQEVYAIRGGKIVRDKIDRIFLSKDSNSKTHEHYKLMSQRDVILSSGEIFATKEDIINSIED